MERAALQMFKKLGLPGFYGQMPTFSSDDAQLKFIKAKLRSAFVDQQFF